MSDAWPAGEDRRSELPRLDDLPRTEAGYDRLAVEDAFDAFYRHAARLDATLRTLAAVETFRRDADALRIELRAFRTPPAEDVRRSAVPGVVFRLAAESALLIAVAVIAGVSHMRPLTIVALMGAAFVVVAVSEALAARSSFVPPVFGFAKARLPEEQELAPEVPLESDPWERGLATETGGTLH